VKALLTALAALLLLAPAASARPLIGIGEQHPQIFTDEAFAPLGIRDVRYIASYDALQDPTERAELDAYLRAAGAAHMRVLLGFGH
jgi:hypothetical protein